MISLTTVIPLATFLAITMGVWAVLSIVADRPINSEERLKRVLNPTAARPDASAMARQQDLFQAKFAVAAKRLGKSLKPSDEAAVGKLRLTLLNAGFRSEHAVTSFYGIKMLAGLACLALAAPVVLTRFGLTQNGIVYILVAGAFGFYLPGMVVNKIKNKRAESIFLGLPDALDLM